MLPLLRATVLVVIVTFVGLIVLSQIGVNIAPLLAGAGIVGIAVGFGSQALVKDVITGLFILVEDTLAVGDDGRCRRRRRRRRGDHDPHHALRDASGTLLHHPVQRGDDDQAT